MADDRKLGFWTELMSGSDNQTPAIGRYLGVLLFLNVAMFLPIGIALALWGRGVEPSVWFAFMTSLVVYVPAMCVSVGGLIVGTHGTEPKASTSGAAQ